MPLMACRELVQSWNMRERLRRGFRLRNIDVGALPSRYSEYPAVPSRYSAAPSAGISSPYSAGIPSPYSAAPSAGALLFGHLQQQERGCHCASDWHTGWACCNYDQRR